MAPQIIRYESAMLPGGVYHNVQKGETLFHLSKKYRVPVSNIARANRIQDKNRIQVGSRLFIPGIYEKGTAQVVKEIPLYKNTGHWEYIVVHHTATLEGDMELITRIHKNRGFGDMGYHFLIDNGTSGRQDGEIEIGSRWYSQKNGAHAKDSNMNAKSIGIALVGNYSDQHDVSPRQMASLAYLIHVLKNQYGISTSRVIQHKDVPGAATECPGNYFPWNQLVFMIE
jgi:N-acetylmuramoyl-L-alanine amidase